MGLPTGSRSEDQLTDCKAFDQCFVCGLAMSEECDYMEDVDIEADGCAPSPDPSRITLCEDCVMWWHMGEDPFDPDEDEDW